MISLVLDVVGCLLLGLGLLLITISLFGVLRMPGTYSQLHAQGLATGPGVICVFASSVATEHPATITFAVLGIAFTIFTAPVSAHAIAQAVRLRSLRLDADTGDDPGDD